MGERQDRRFRRRNQTPAAGLVSSRLDAVDSAERACRLEPEMLFEPVRCASGQIVDFLIREANAASRASFVGSRCANLIGQKLTETFRPVVGSGLLAMYVRCADTGEAVVIDDFGYFVAQLGTTRRFEIRAARTTRGWVSVHYRDVTDRHEAIRRLARAEENYRLLAENSADVVARFRDGKVVWVSPSVRSAFGAPPQQWIGTPVASLVPPEDLPIIADILARTDDGGTVVQRLRVRDAAGIAHWAEIHAKTFYDANGRPDGRIAHLRVVDTAAGDETAAPLESHCHRMMENSIVPTALNALDGRFIMVNQAMCTLFGYEADALLHMNWQELTAAEYLDLDAVEDMLVGRTTAYRATKPFIRADGQSVWGDVLASCLHSPDGSVENVITQIVDITDEVESRQQLARREQQNRVLAERLQVQTDRLEHELDSAAHYVASILPTDLDGPVSVSSRYLPSRTLGGDCYEFRWIDDDHVLIKLLDVSGHGIEAALLAVSIHNLLRSGTLPVETLRAPQQTLTELNRLFPMDDHGGHYFTIWYGVYQPSTRTLSYASAGHPPALVFTGAGADPVELSTAAGPVGMFEDSEFQAATYVMPPDAQMLVYSDGAFELALPDGDHWTLTEFVELCTKLAASSDWSLDTILDHLRDLQPNGFKDDCSLIKADFP